MLHVNVRIAVEISHLRKFSQSRGHGRATCNQLLCISVFRVKEDISDGIFLHNIALVHYDSAVGDFGDHSKVVGDEQHSHAVFFLQIANQFEDVFLDGDVQSGGGFVGDEEFRVTAHGHGNHDALFLSAGEFMWVGVENLRGARQSHFVEQVENTLFSLFFADFIVQEYLFGNLFAAPDDRIQGGHRFLENHADLISPKGLHDRFRRFQDVDGLVILLIVEEDTAGWIASDLRIE